MTTSREGPTPDLHGRHVLLIIAAIAASYAAIVLGVTFLEEIISVLAPQADRNLTERFFDHQLGIAFATALEQLLAIFCVYMFAVRAAPQGWQTVGCRPIGRRWIYLAIVLSLAIAGISTVIEVLIESPLIDNLREDLGITNVSFSAIASSYLTIAVLAPVSEEFLFRGALYGWLRQRWGVAVAMLLSTSLFAVLHVEPLLILFAFVFGLVLTALFEWSRSLWVPIIAHGVNNSVAVAWMFGTL